MHLCSCVSACSCFPKEAVANVAGLVSCVSWRGCRVSRPFGPQSTQTSVQWVATDQRGSRHADSGQKGRGWPSDGLQNIVHTYHLREPRSLLCLGASCLSRRRDRTPRRSARRMRRSRGRPGDVRHRAGGWMPGAPGQGPECRGRVP